MSGQGNSRFTFILLSATFTLVGFRPALAEPAPVELSTTVGAQQFANEGAPAGRVDLQAALRSSSAELHFYSFFETDSQGDRSFDLDQTLVRLGVGNGAHLWFGRTLPMAEGAADPVKTTSAIGAKWVQNQSNPLTPRASGWIGTGVHFNSPTSGLFFNAAYSPVFLPSFGPSIEFSETQDAKGTRFSRLPPAGVYLSDQRFPLRYRINTGNIADIVLQPQAFVEAGHDSSKHRFSILAWSAPSPSAHSSASGVLRVDAQDASVLATVVPDFPRETYYGARWLTRELVINPEFELLYERDSGKYVVSASFSAGNFFEAGFLTTLHEPVVDAPPQGASPIYASDLAWLELQAHLLHDRLVPSLRVERHLKQWPADQWLRPALRYAIDSKTNAFASASILTGTDSSYFGGWRSLDSIAMGVQYQW